MHPSATRWSCQGPNENPHARCNFSLIVIVYVSLDWWLWQVDYLNIANQIYHLLLLVCQSVVWIALQFMDNFGQFIFRLKEHIILKFWVTTGPLILALAEGLGGPLGFKIPFIYKMVWHFTIGSVVWMLELSKVGCKYLSGWMNNCSI